MSQNSRTSLDPLRFLPACLLLGLAMIFGSSCASTQVLSSGETDLSKLAVLKQPSGAVKLIKRLPDGTVLFNDYGNMAAVTTTSFTLDPGTYELTIPGTFTMGGLQLTMEAGHTYQVVQPVFKAPFIKDLGLQGSGDSSKVAKAVAKGPDVEVAATEGSEEKAEQLTAPASIHVYRVAQLLAPPQAINAALFDPDNKELEKVLLEKGMAHTFKTTEPVVYARCWIGTTHGVQYLPVLKPAPGQEFYIRIDARSVKLMPEKAHAKSRTEYDACRPVGP